MLYLWPCAVRKITLDAQCPCLSLLKGNAQWVLYVEVWQYYEAMAPALFLLILFQGVFWDGKKWELWNHATLCLNLTPASYEAHLLGKMTQFLQISIFSSVKRGLWHLTQWGTAVRIKWDKIHNHSSIVDAQSVGKPSPSLSLDLSCLFVH